MAKNLRKKLGDLGERLSVAKLTELGYRVIETNWRCEIGELDVVAWHGECLTFIEVRTRKGGGAGTPEDSISPAKQQRLLSLAEAYLQANPGLYNTPNEYPPCRIDMAAVEFDAAGRLTRLQIRQNIVESS
ncbi:MAG TPA: YraN family protein [Chloroflexia bacterium]|nr:YraN family protein [Chloroflexia bacterium]